MDEKFLLHLIYQKVYCENVDETGETPLPYEEWCRCVEEEALGRSEHGVLRWFSTYDEDG